jgi:biopolymer transport protein ExbB/TolQ
MLSNLFLGFSLVGAEWVLYMLVAISVISVTIMFERWKYYGVAARGLAEFRAELRTLVGAGKIEDALVKAETRRKSQEQQSSRDLETDLAVTLLQMKGGRPEILNEAAQDSVIRAKIDWERSLPILATIGSNTPFLGLFGTVLGIIKAFHDLSKQAATEASSIVMAGVSEALIATAVGIIVALPAVVAFNLFQRKVRTAISEAEALKSYLVGKVSG